MPRLPVPAHFRRNVAGTRDQLRGKFIVSGKVDNGYRRLLGLETRDLRDEVALPVFKTFPQTETVEHIEKDRVIGVDVQRQRDMMLDSQSRQYQKTLIYPNHRRRGMGEIRLRIGGILPAIGE